MDDPSVPGPEAGHETAASTKPAETAPELGQALRLLALAIVGLLRRSRARCAVFLRRAIPAGANAWHRLRRAVACGAALFSSAAATSAARLQRAASWPSRGGAPHSLHPRVRAFAFGIICTIAVLVLGGGGFLAYCAFTLPLSGGLAAQTSPPAIVVEDDAGKAFASRGNFKGEPITLDQLPANLVHAVLAIEDRRFFEHSGIDVSGILRAALRDLQSGTVREGGSTITQQLVRLTYLSSERSIRRKVQEVVLAVWL
jgi:penicillin-binding protein 1A